MSAFTVAVTALSVAGTPFAYEGSYTKTVGSSARTYSSTFTRLGTSGTATRPYGAFPKAAATEFYKTADLSVVPVVTIGPINDIDLDITISVIPKAAMVSTVGRAVAASMTVRPRLAQSRGQVNSTGTTPKSASLSIVPVVTMAAVASDILATGNQNVVPVLTMASAIDDVAQQAIPVSLSIVPVVGITTGVNRVNASQAWNIPFVAIPALTMSSSVQTAGEVDRITINASPTGRIRITKV